MVLSSSTQIQKLFLKPPHTLAKFTAVCILQTLFSKLRRDWIQRRNLLRLRVKLQPIYHSKVEETCELVGLISTLSA